MSTEQHLSLETLADIADNRLTSEALDAAMSHVNTCSACDQKLRRLQQLIVTMKSDTAPDAPRDVLLSAINIFPAGAQSALRRIVATLMFDSRSAGPAFGMRSLHKASRQLVYSAEETDLDLRITIQNDECIVAGQLLRDTCAGGLVEISGTTGSAETSLNELCEFTLPAMPVGNYALRIKMPDIEIEIPELELKH
jgi:hypothetical protein